MYLYCQYLQLLICLSIDLSLIRFLYVFLLTFSAVFLLVYKCCCVFLSVINMEIAVTKAVLPLSLLEKTIYYKASSKVLSGFDRHKWILRTIPFILCIYNSLSDWNSLLEFSYQMFSLENLHWLLFLLEKWLKVGMNGGKWMVQLHDYSRINYCHFVLNYVSFSGIYILLYWSDYKIKILLLNSF